VESPAKAFIRIPSDNEYLRLVEEEKFEQEAWITPEFEVRDTAPGHSPTVWTSIQLSVRLSLYTRHHGGTGLAWFSSVLLKRWWKDLGPSVNGRGTCFSSTFDQIHLFHVVMNFLTRQHAEGSASSRRRRWRFNRRILRIQRSDGDDSIS